MADNMTLRSAFNGFNRRDVLACIEQLNNDHKVRIQSLEAQLRQLQEENARLLTQLEEAQARTAEPCDSDVQELEVYRRAERTEREARERAARVSRQTESALKDVAQVVDQSAERISQLMNAWTEAVELTREELLSAAETVSAISQE